MNILFWILQFLLAFHTLIGAVWKFSHSAAETMPSLGAIPDGAWVGLAVFEVLCALALIVPAFKKRMAFLIPLALGGIALEMIAFCGLHFASGATDRGPMIYWIIVAALCGFIAYGRLVLAPIQGAQKS